MIYAIRNNEKLEGVYTEETFNSEWSKIKGLSIRCFKDEDIDKAKKWIYDKKSIERTKKRKEKASKKKVQAKKKKTLSSQTNTKPKRIKTIDALKKVRELLSEKNIVTGYGEDCTHEEFDIKVISYLCPWDRRVLEGYNGSVNCGCYYKCAKRDDKILENKEIYLKSIDKLIMELEKNPDLPQNFKVENGTLSESDKEILSKWDKEKEEKEKMLYKEISKYNRENRVSFVGCPKELISDLKYLSDNKCFDEDKFRDFEFCEDKIILTYLDWSDCEETTDIDCEDIHFSIMPSMDKSCYEIELGNGCVYMIENPITNENKQLLEDFYFKWKEYRKLNPDKYKDTLHDLLYADGEDCEDFEDLADKNIDKINDVESYPEDMKKILSQIECEICMFVDHCNGLFCLKG